VKTEKRIMQNVCQWKLFCSTTFSL